MVNVKNLFKTYGNQTVVSDVSAEIEPGKITTFIGPNGAGKSTLMSMVSRLIERDSGDVLLDQRDVSGTPSRELAKQIAILKQSNEMNVRLTVEELVTFGRFPYSQGRLTSEDRRYVKEAITYMELDEMKDKFLDQLSGGQRQRAFIAMVIAQDTDYILLDEPLNNLDLKHSVQIMKVLRQLVDDLGKTVVLVIHDINFASCYSDYIIAMKDGEVFKEGTTDEIIDREVLRDIYELDMTVHHIDQQKICVYF
ncbi:iron ABC transporter ATP-binding protein [Salibacterium qingdaonense]|uniref:Iron complex transport system ATP-binding protein n=1 Tax=Salibacterium qingdaonense TaxID=266892 RepID=A0A1I4LWZ9_9BACI|nr:ABC transporter ATP-binding protein [Salibacterium qingdaonense]SFL95541.1 iron complex transport system ATP-binding protein [Salibacterium qingdaonense]